MSSYYVAPTGSDSAGGSATTPWKTLQHAANLVQPGDVVTVRAGTYDGFIMGWNFPQGGTSSSRITFQADPGTIINAKNNKTLDAIDLEGSSYITIAGFTIAPGTSQTNWRSGIRAAGGGTGLEFRDNTIQLRSIDQCGIVTSFTTDLLVQGNTVSGGYDTGIYVANSAIRPIVRGNRISNSLGNGLLLNADVSQGSTGVIPGALVENNIISDVGMGGQQAKFGPGSAMNLGAVKDSVFRNNLIYNAHAKGITLAQLQGSQGSTNNLLVNNTVMIASDGQSAIRLADSSTGNTLYNNVLYSASSAGTITSSAASLTGLVMDYNAVASRFSGDDGDSTITLSQWQSQNGQDRHSLLLDATRAFVNPSGNNYHLSSTSPLLDVGTSLRAPSTDLDGGARPKGAGYDIGAFEYQAAADTTAPKVSSTAPSSGATGVSTAVSVTATFSEAVQSGTISLVLRDAANNVVPASLSYASSSNTATLKPSSALAGSTRYTATLGGAKDMAGNAMSGTTTWSFTTAASDTTAPKVSSATPSSGATGVSTGASVTARFSEAVQSGTISLVLRDAANNVVPASLSYASSSNTATLKPSSALAGSTRYTATLGGAKDMAGNAMSGTTTWSFTTAASDTTAPVSASSSLWGSSTLPASPSDPDTNSVELGVKFTSDVSGSITGIRFYKGSGNSGTHVGHLWSGTGQLLASATFTSETASGWQQVDFAKPVAIQANATYVASYLAPAGHYAADVGYFGSSYASGPLHVPAGGSVYRYGSGGFPTQTWKATNYWVSPVLSSTDTTAPKVSSTTPSSGATGVSTGASVTARFSEAVQSGTISLVLRDAANNVVPASLSYASSSNTATLKPSSALAGSTRYTATLGGAKDMAGNAMSGTTTWSFTTAASDTAAPVSASSSLWGSSTQPASPSASDPNSVELGVKFTSDVSGSITGIRFYKGSGNSGTHVGHLWSGTGQLLASATFTSETASGWQQVDFAKPVAIQANATYVASYLAPAGHYAADAGYFGSGYASGPLRVPAGGSVYRYGSGGFPTQSWKATNYWVSPVLSTAAASNASPSTTLAATTGSPLSSGSGVARTTVASSMDPVAIPYSITSPSPAGVDHIFNNEESSFLSSVLGNRRKRELA